MEESHVLEDYALLVTRYPTVGTCFRICNFVTSFHKEARQEGCHQTTTMLLSKDNRVAKIEEDQSA